ncbi:thiamine phosphate synthase [Microbacterium indicum]|uniref:thiamine phosphate synthase n=1 Tax=Microbacterium indicum TaxID=358100 RepID=UPI0003FA991D|nr:thiamine phosphate synthase [Microbacterium indicum]
MIDLSLYLVTDAGHAASAGRSVADVVAAAAAGGATAVQVREKDAPARDALAAVLAAAAALEPFPRVALIVDDRVDVAVAAHLAGARVAGAHVGQSDLPAPAARAMLASAGIADPVVGVSASTPGQLARAARDGADYAGIGAVRPTATKRDAPASIGVDGFRALAAASALPAVAIGGIGEADARPLREAGAAGIAVVSAICAAPDPRAAAAALRAAFSGVDA